MPLSVLLLTLLAVPLAKTSPRQGRYGKLLVAICSLGGLRRINSGVLELESLPTAEPAYVKMGFSMTGLVKNQLNHFRLSGPSVFVLVGSQLQFIQKGGVL